MYAFVESFDPDTGTGVLAEMGNQFRLIGFAGYPPTRPALQPGDVVMFALDDRDGIALELVERKTNFEDAASAAQDKTKCTAS